MTEHLPQYRRVTSYTPGQQRAAEPPTKPPKKRKKLKKFVLFMLGIVIGFSIFAGWLLYKNGAIFQGNVLSLLSQGEPLKKDSFGRTNVLVFGTSEDDPAHPGGDLTDSIMIVSLYQKKHTALTISVPRDLWIDYGDECRTSAGKINALYSCVKYKTDDEQAAQKALRSQLGNVFGMDIPYSVHLNNTVVSTVVDALGGIDITIDSTDPRGILDRNFDWRCKYRCYLVKYPNGPAHLSGEQAKYLSQARGANGGYGLARGNFDRENNQRKIMMGIKSKAGQSGYLQNPITVLKLINSLGDNLKTNINTGEVRSFIKAIRESGSINPIGLGDQKPALITTGRGPDGTSIVRPIDGLYDYDSLQAFITATLTPPIESPPANN